MIRQPVELVLFDLGGTLFFQQRPSGDLYHQADAELWNVLHEAGVTLQPQELYGEAGNLIELYYRRGFDDLREPTTAAVLAGLLRAKGYVLEEASIRSALRAMYAVTQPNWRLEEDALPVLQRLKRMGFQIGAVSNGADDENTQALIDRAGIRPYLQFVVSSAAHGRRKPDPSIFKLALDHFGAAPERAMMVGDDYEADVLGAHGAGIQAIWITRRSVKPLPDTSRNEPNAVVAALSEIPSLLEAGSAGRPRLV